MCLEKQHNAGSSTSGEGKSLFTQKLWEWFSKSSSITIPWKKSVYNRSWSFWSGFSKSCEFYISWKSLMARSPAGAKQACGPGSWGEVASTEFAVSLLPSLGFLAGFLPRCWCCPWCLNVIYGKIHWGYTVWKVHISVSDTYRSYNCFCHSLYLWLWLQKWSVLGQPEGRQRQLLYRLQLFCLTSIIQSVIFCAPVTGEVTAPLSPVQMYVVTHLTVNLWYRLKTHVGEKGFKWLLVLGY